MRFLKNFGLKALAVCGAAIASVGTAFAQTATGPDMSGITSQIEWGTVTVAILGVAGGIAVVYIAYKGAKLVLSAIKGA